MSRMSSSRNGLIALQRQLQLLDVHCSKCSPRRTIFTASKCTPRLALSTRTNRDSKRTTRTPTMLTRARIISLASSQSTRPSEIPKARSALLNLPTVRDLEEQELEVDLIPEDHVNLVLTNRAAEQLQRISAREGNPGIALRISVESGGCHGYQYKMELAHARASEDYHLTHPDIRPSNLYIDAVSLPMLNGSTVDYATELIGSSFRVTGNPQAKGGCGCGVSWELSV